MNKAYNKITWQNKPSTATPLNQTNLNEMSNALDTIDDRVIALDSGKVGSVTVTNTLQTGDTIATITVDGTATNIKSAQVVVDSTPSSTSENPLQNKAIYEMLNNLLPEETVQGNPISISDASGLNAKACSVDLLPIQDLHGYDSPWAGGAGKNKYPIKIGRDSFNDNVGGTHSTDNDILTVVMASSVNSGAYSRGIAELNKLIGKYNEAVTYSFDVKSNVSCNINIGYEGYGFKTVSLTTAWKRISITTTATSTEKSFLIYNASADAKTVEVKDFMFELGSTANNYEPYSNICPISGRTEVNLTVADAETSPTQTETYTETLGQTVYGGTLDVTNGKLTIDRAIVDMGDYTWSRNTAGTYGYWWKSGFTGVDLTKDLFAEQYKCYKTDLNVAQGNKKGITVLSNNNLYVCTNDSVNEPDGLLCYPLATPTEITLTPEEISLLKGINVVSTDGDNIKLVYSADIGLYIAGQLQNS